MNQTNIQELWVLEGAKPVSSVCCGAQEMAGLYFSITECAVSSFPGIVLLTWASRLK